MTDPLFFAFAVPAVLFAAISKGGFGSGAAFAATPLLALVMEPAAAVALMLPLLMMMDVASLRAYWRRWSAVHAKALMVGGVPGIVFGAAVFGLVSADGLRVLLGAMALGFVAFEIARARGLIAPPAMRPGQGLFWGSIAGFTSFVSHAGGPPAAIYLLGSRLAKTEYQATTVIAFWWINLVKLPFYVGLGLFAADAWIAMAILAPVALLGVAAGVWAHTRLPERAFFAVTYVLLTVTGLRLVWDGLG